MTTPSSFPAHLYKKGRKESTLIKPMTEDRIQYLYNQYLNNACSEAELEELKAAVADPENDAAVTNLLDLTWTDLNAHNLKDMEPERAGLLFKKIVNRKRHRTLRLWPRIAAAAIVLLALSFSLIQFVNNRKPQHSGYAKRSSDIPPGTNKALLTLENGQTISLNSSKNGIIVADNKFLYADGSTVSHSDPTGKTGAGAGESGAEQYAVLATPAGGQYQIVLSDGTKVWLNADSRLRYPVHFNKAARTVELEGEGYFEVAKDESHPFIVNSQGQKIEVLGTHFNVNAYKDRKAIKTTLMEGSVRISSMQNQDDQKSVILKPGQQSRLVPGSDQIAVNTVNIDEAMDWKDGLFLFNDESLESIMNRISHWYNVEVVYKGNVDHIRFVGTYPRNKGLNNLLRNIEQTDKVSFKSEESSNGKERRIIVTANY